MPWWPWRGTQRTRTRTGGVGAGVSELSAVAERDFVAETTALLESSIALDTGRRVEVPAQRSPEAAAKPVTMARVSDALDRLEIRYLTDGDGSLLAMWERHALLFALEGPDDETLVMRGPPHGTVPPDWADRSPRVVNEWKPTRRFCKAYIGDATERGQLPI